MRIDLSLYLAQSYKDAWSDYQRSLVSSAFPVWDYIVLTASNSHQAEGFRTQLRARKHSLPPRTVYSVLPDEGNVRVGSGGATLSVLKSLREEIPCFEGKRILVIHSGGDSKRVPQYSALGKLFSPVPHKLPDGRSGTLFDELLISMSAVPERIREGMLLLSGDALLLFNPLMIDYPGHGAAVLSFKEDVETGKNHGVYVRGDSGNVRRFLHKQDTETLRKCDAVNDANAVDIDTGAVIFGVDVLNALYGLISTDGVFDDNKYKELVNETVRLSLYGDFQYPMAEDSTLDQFYREKPEGVYSEKLKEARSKIWDALHGFPMKLLRLAPAKFIHFGTSKEILELMSTKVEQFKYLDWHKRVNCSMNDRAAGYNSVLSPNAKIGRNNYLEVSYVHNGACVGDNCILSYIDILRDTTIPDNVVLHGLKQSNGWFVCRIYGIEDNPKEGSLFGRSLEEFAVSVGLPLSDLWDDNSAHDLWDAKLYPEFANIQEAVAWALKIHEMIISNNKSTAEAWRALKRKSLGMGFHDADPDAILSWNNRMKELVQMNDVMSMIDNKEPVSNLQHKLGAGLTTIQREWMANQLKRADYGKAMRLHYYVGAALEGISSETEYAEAFKTLQQAILEETMADLQENKAARICRDRHQVSLPLRVNWGGGWSDTPPFCNENGGTVLNAAILLNGERPVRVTLQRLDEHKIIFESRDTDTYGEFDDIEVLQSVGDPFDPFVLQKAALLACGVIPAKGGDLHEVLTRLGGGLLMNTEVVGVPKGSGLGTSSILSAACIKALYEFLGIEHEEEDLYRQVLCMEQIMSTGGGWQDQVGGVTDGIKYITSRPGLKQDIKVEHLTLDNKTIEELNNRFALIYTGQRRLARNILRDVVGRYIGNIPESLHALNKIQRIAALMKFELERGNVDAFAKLLDDHWKLSQRIDAGSTNTLINQIFDSVDDLLAGRMICGAGGGGFLQVVLQKGVRKEQLQERLQDVFLDTDIGVWDCLLV
jgi:fucokinase